MKGKLVLPLQYIELNGPVIFLAGPIQGADNWQNIAIRIIQKIAPDINIANPRRDYLDEKFVYEKQVDWETHYLRRAGKEGVILFWLAKEFEHNCERAYAQTSRFEIGEWKEKCINDEVKLVVEIEEGFTGAKYIKRRFFQDCPNIPVFSSLKETCVKAVELVKLA